MSIFRGSAQQISEKSSSNQIRTKNKEKEIRRWRATKKVTNGLKWSQCATDIKYQSPEAEKEENREPQKHTFSATLSGKFIKISKPKDDSLLSLRSKIALNVEKSANS